MDTSPRWSFPDRAGNVRTLLGAVLFCSRSKVPLPLLSLASCDRFPLRIPTSTTHPGSKDVRACGVFADKCVNFRGDKLRLISVLRVIQTRESFLLLARG